MSVKFQICYSSLKKIFETGMRIASAEMEVWQRSDFKCLLKDILRALQEGLKTPLEYMETTEFLKTVQKTGNPR